MWNSILSDLRKDYLYSSETSVNSIANILVLRGKDATEAASGVLVSEFVREISHPNWVTAPVQIWSHGAYGRYSERSLNMKRSPIHVYEKSATLVGNDCQIAPPLTLACHKATQMFRARAFVHQYRRYGLEEQDLMERFSACDQIAVDYSELIPSQSPNSSQHSSALSWQH